MRPHGPRSRSFGRLRPLGLALAGALAATLLAAPPASADQAGHPGRGDSVPHICDPADSAACMLPFPNDWFTVADPSTDSGRRVNLSVLATPRTAGAVPIDPREWNRNDGFSPGSALLTRVPGLDLGRTGAAPITDIGASLRKDAPIVLLDAETGKRAPYFAELDVNAPEERRLLIVRPARNLREGHRYLVLLRNLRDSSGAKIPQGAAVRRMLGGTPAGPVERSRGEALRDTVRELRRHGVSTRGLHLAWDFTVASTRGLTERAVHMRDEAFAELGDEAPKFTVDRVTEFTPEEEPDLARRIEGTIDVPSYLNLPGGPPGSALHYGPDGLPEPLPGNVQHANFRCNVPRSALSRPARPVLYGHGLLGRAAEIDSGRLKEASNEHNLMLCATDWIGMAQEDIPNVVSVFADFSRFKTIPDRQQQSYLNFLFLGRALVHPEGLASATAFGTDGRPVFGAGLTYAGASQGGIQGVALTALAQDFRRSALIVPAINYSTLLNRSVDFDPFQRLLDVTHPDRLDQQIVLAMLQMLWDRGEGNGYAAHVTRDALPDTPAHRVLIHEAFGDHQVANIGTETMARTIGGVRVREPALADGRVPDVEPMWDIRGIKHFPYHGSALVVWDDGTPAPPLTNTPNRAGEDPHGSTRAWPPAMAQLATFLKTGTVTDPCGPTPCTITPP